MNLFRVAAAAGSLLSTACGARTGLPLTSGDVMDGGSEANGVDGAVAGSTLCSLNQGPVSACDAGLSAGPVQRCDSLFPLCAEEFPEVGWGCCQTNLPDGRQNCVYTQLLPDASCE